MALFATVSICVFTSSVFSVGRANLYARAFLISKMPLISRSANDAKKKKKKKHEIFVRVNFCV